MRELAVQASNDTNNDDDRGQIQKEIDQLISEIDRIGNTTEFNTKKLINGGANVSGTVGTGLEKYVKIVGGTGDTKVGASVTITATQLATAAKATKSDAFSDGAVVTGGLNITINGTKFSFAEKVTIENVLKTINDAGLGVVATAEGESGEDLVLRTTAEGSSATLVTDAGGNIETYTGTDAEITLPDGEQYCAQGNVITIQSGRCKRLTVGSVRIHKYRFFLVRE